MKKLIYHGSPVILPRPYYGGGKLYNDFGRGFYCTEHHELAMEWACTEGQDGFVNRYQLDMDGLTVRNLADEADAVLVWITMLVTCRNLRLSTPLMRRAKIWLQQHYSSEPESTDVLIGYRADDSYFSFARAFLSNQITLGQLSEAMRLGQPGEQVVLKSEEAYRHISFEGFERADSGEYYPKRRRRDEAARARCREILESDAADGVYMMDLMREDKNDDSL